MLLQYKRAEWDYYRVPTDEQGNSVLTGEGGGNKYKRFTLSALETLQVTY